MGPVRIPFIAFVLPDFHGEREEKVKKNTLIEALLLPLSRYFESEMCLPQTVPIISTDFCFYNAGYFTGPRQRSH